MGGGGLIVYMYGLCLCFIVMVVGTAVGLTLYDRIQRRRTGKQPRFVARSLPIRPPSERPPPEGGSDGGEQP